MKLLSLIACLLTLMTAATLAQPARAQGLLTAGTQAAAEPVAETPKDPLGRDTPRGMIKGFVDEVAKENWAEASAYLDLSSLPARQQKTKGPEYAQGLQTLLNQGGWLMPGSMISDELEGKANDTIESDTDRIGALRTRDKAVDIIAQRMKGADGAEIWLISGDTLKPIPAMLEDIKPSLIDRALPKTLKERRLWGVPSGHWLALLALAVFAYFPAWGITKAMGAVVNRCRKQHRTDRVSVFPALELPLRLYISVWIFVLAGSFVGISALARQYVSIVPVIVGWLSLIMFIWRFIDIAADRAQQIMSKRGKLGMFSVIYFIRRAAKFIFIATAAIIILSTLGVDVSTALAALGIGGIALALGAQKTVENFVGSIMLVLDQPVRLGDFCTIGNTSGTVEDIGMRSTRLRTAARTVVTIPNGEFSAQQIENFSRRDRYLFNPTIGLRYETTPEQIRFLLVELRAILYAHPKVSPDPARVRFSGFGTNSLNLDFFSYVTVPNFDEFTEVQEDLLLRIMETVARSGTGLALPTQITYQGNDLGLSAENSRASEAKVQEWRESGHLHLPRFDADSIARLKDTLDYPPTGSVVPKQ